MLPAHRILVAWYVPALPVFVVGDDPVGLTFRVAVGDQTASLSGPASLADLDIETDAARRHATRSVLTCLHQPAGFRTRVLRAYREQCAICRLRHAELLEAAHILPDGTGEPNEGRVRQRDGHPHGDPSRGGGCRERR
jgi:putative restriction endonuclease